MKLAEKKRRKLNNKGYAMVLVIVAIALGTITVSALLTLSLYNYQMKVTENRAKDTFYSAEEVLDQINIGLQRLVSTAAGDAYIKSMQTYKMTGKSETERINEFKVAYMMQIRSVLNSAEPDRDMYYIGGDAAEYDAVKGIYTKGLLSFLDNTFAGMYKAWQEGTAQTNIINVSCETAVGNSMESTTEGLLLKDLKVEYVNADGYYSSIKTDMMIHYPDVSLKEASVIPNVFEYALIAGKQLAVKDVQNVSLLSNVFSGEDGVVLQNARNITLETNVDYLVTKGDITVDAISSLNLLAKNVWAQGVEVQGGSLRTDAETSSYVADDLTISGEAARVSLAGNYYGYSGSSKAEKKAELQSAIIINGKKAELDMTTLKKLLLNGTAYVKPEVSSVELDGVTKLNTEAVLGNSVSARADQIVFLVPPECMGTKDGMVLIGRNPLTESQYEEWMGMKNEQGYSLIDTGKVVSNVGHPLKDYMAGGTPDSHYQTIFHNINGETLCYVFLKLDEEDAARYYADYAATAADKLNGYLSKYENKIMVNGRESGMTSIDAKGNVLANVSGDSVSIISNNLTMGSDAFEQARVFEESSSLSYQALCSKLTTNYSGLTTEELTNGNVYVNLINHNAVDALTQPAVYTAGGNSAVIAKENIRIKSGQKAQWSTGEAEQVKLLITSGDVEIEGDFSGLIICGGVITLKTTGTTIKNDNAAVTMLLQQTIAADSLDTVIKTYFKNGERYVLGAGSGGEDSGYVNLENVITYMNWKKQ